MGGPSYDRDVYSSSSSSGYSRKSEEAMSSSYLHDDLNPKGKTIETLVAAPIVFLLDHTGSMHGDPKVFMDKAPMLHGQIEMQGYLKDFAISFCGIGDARHDEKGALQVGNFEKGIALDDVLKKMWLQKAGGSGGEETYELAVYYYLHHCKMPNAEMPFLFIFGDEGFYKDIPAEVIKKYIGGKQVESQDSNEVFAEVNKKFKKNVFLIHRKYQDAEYDEEILNQWKSVLPPQHVVCVEDAKSIVDVVLGIIAMVSKTRDLETYKADMKSRGQDTKRISTVSSALTPLSKTMSLVKVNDLPAITGIDRKEGTKRNKK